MEDIDLLLDTGVFIRHLRSRQKKGTLYWRLRQRYNLATTAVSEMELLVGAVTPAHRRDIDNVLYGLPRLAFDSRAAQQAAEAWRKLRRANQQVEIRDLMIAAIALAHGLPLVTFNPEHYKRFKGLQVLDESAAADIAAE